MTCAEFLEGVALYAMGALTPDEARDLEAHVERSGPHDGCAEALAKARVDVAALDAALPLPPAELWSRIDAAIGDSAPAAAPTPAPAKIIPLRPARAPWIIAAVALAAAVALIPWGFRLRGERDEAIARAHMAESDATDLRVIGKETATALAERQRCQGDLEKLQRDLTLYRDAVALLDIPGTKVVAMAPQGTHKQPASVIYHLGLKRALVVGVAFQVPTGKAAQLWIIRGKGAPIAAGFVTQLPGGITVGDFDPKLLESPPDAFAISLEPPGGSPAPTDVVLVGARG